MQSNFKETPPTLQDFHAELLKQDEPEAQEIALAIELFTSGSLNTFAKPTNVDEVTKEFIDRCSKVVVTEPRRNGRGDDGEQPNADDNGSN
jgi:hypothetical protein